MSTKLSISFWFSEIAGLESFGSSALAKCTLLLNARIKTSTSVDKSVADMFRKYWRSQVHVWIAMLILPAPFFARLFHTALAVPSQQNAFNTARCGVRLI